MIVFSRCNFCTILVAVKSHVILSKVKFILISSEFFSSSNRVEFVIQRTDGNIPYVLPGPCHLIEVRIHLIHF